jgi:hypothetical protein
MLSARTSPRNILSSKGQLSAASDRLWIRLRSTARSPYGTLLYFGSRASAPAQSSEKAGRGHQKGREYTVKIGHKVFRSDDPKALVKLAVAARRHSRS